MVVQVVDPQLVHRTLLELELQDKVRTVVLVVTATVLAPHRNGAVAVAVAQVQLVERVHQTARQVQAVLVAQFRGSQRQQHARFQ